ncbi:MAG: hypothetical protein EOP31_24390 [Rhodococcus sp. (in: high G+C Gram-positive bacteria)]|nr:MAG: hypothetical protein EOP31_24390 [Rhodococcus sp. (in: high G+C Gram-positive bacteria)]
MNTSSTFTPTSPNVPDPTPNYCFIALHNPRFGTFDNRLRFRSNAPRIGMAVDEVTKRIRDEHGAWAFPFAEVFDLMPGWVFVTTLPIDRKGSRVVGVVHPRELSEAEVIDQLGKALNRFALRSFFPQERRT